MILKKSLKIRLVITFKTATKINGDISYNFLPSPQNRNKKIDLSFKKWVKIIILKKAILLLSISKLNNLNN